LTAAPFDLRAELDHLVDGLLARQAIDELGHDARQLLLALAGAQFEQDLDHHRHHDGLPAFADQGQRSVKVKQHGADPAAFDVGIDDLDVCTGKKGHWDLLMARTARAMGSILATICAAGKWGAADCRRDVNKGKAVRLALVGWWRCRESNPGPKNSTVDMLQA